MSDDWDGEERRRDNIDFSAAIEDIHRLRQTVIDVAATVGPLVDRVATFPPREEVEAAVNDVRGEQKMWTQRFAVLVAVLVVLAGLNLALLFQHRHQSIAKINQIGRCMLLQTLEHRGANERAHEGIAAKVGSDYKAQVGEEPPTIPDELRPACVPLLKGVQ